MQVGLGPLGRKLTPALIGHPGLKLVAAVDIARELAGRDVAQLADLDACGVAVGSDVSRAMAAQRPDIAIVTTVSSFLKLARQIEPIIDAGVAVISTCEELAYPWRSHPDAARALDERAKASGARILGTGINPGFLMDLWPIVATAPCLVVEHLRVRRVQDASARRVPFQQKIGAGLDLDAFTRLHEEGRLRHVGLGESLFMIADRLGIEIAEWTETLDPIIARTPVASADIRVQAGCAAGVRQVARAFLPSGREVIALEFAAAIGQEGSADIVEIAGTPSLRLCIEGGVNGDIGTAAMLVNSVPSLLSAAPGLHSMVDIRPVSWWR